MGLVWIAVLCLLWLMIDLCYLFTLAVLFVMIRVWMLVYVLFIGLVFNYSLFALCIAGFL